MVIDHANEKSHNIRYAAGHELVRSLGLRPAPQRSPVSGCKVTFTPKLSNMLSAHQKGRARGPPFFDQFEIDVTKC